MPLRRKAARASAENGRGYGDGSMAKKSRIDAKKRTAITDKEHPGRSEPNLQWGYIDIATIVDFKDYAKPTKCALPHLSTFCITFRDAEEDAPQFIFSLLFAGLHLPAAHTLALSWFICDAFYDHDTTAKLYTVLQSTPAVTTLILAENFLALVDPGSYTKTPTATEHRHVKPVWSHAIHLVDLQLEVPQPGPRERTKDDVEEVLDIFVRDPLFADGSWLDLHNSACPIQTVTIVDNASPSDDSDSDGGSDYENVGDFTMATIRKHAEKAPNVIFQLTSKSASHVVADAWIRGSII